jgi:D-alanyl-D-alanine carboxypeptidase
MANTSETCKSILDAALEAQLQAGCPGVILEINSPDQGFSFSAACGHFSREGSRLLLPDDLFRVASVSKAFTAVVTVILAAREKWQLDDPIIKYLPDNIGAYLESMRGTHPIKTLTIRRLLNHSSGIPDYFFDQDFQNQVKAQPLHMWQPNELIAAAAGVGELLFTPGKEFCYGDTAYVLVGIAIEETLQMSLAQAYRALILSPLGMTSTWLENSEEFDVGSLSHHYAGEEDLRYNNYSFDWAGGGLVSTAADLALFLQGLFSGQLLEDQWLQQIFNWQGKTRWRPHSSARYLKYGLGLGVNRAYGEEVVGVTGVWGAFAYYWPANRTAVAGTLNLVGADRAALMDEVIRALSIWPQLKSPA